LLEYGFTRARDQRALLRLNPVERVAEAVDFGDAENMRRTFIRICDRNWWSMGSPNFEGNDCRNPASGCFP